MPKIINFVAYSWAILKGLEIIVKNLYRENERNFYFQNSNVALHSTMIQRSNPFLMDKIKSSPTFFLFDKPFCSNIHHREEKTIKKILFLEERSYQTLKLYYKLAL